MKLATILSLCLLFTALPGRADPLLVFAAASLAEALETVNDGYDGAEVTASYAGSSTLARQIEAGAPADVFISANTGWMDVLQAEGLVVAAQRRNLLSGNLVVVGHGAAPPLPSLEALDAALGTGRLAVALTSAVPAGIYTRQALEAAGLWDRLEPRLAETDNVRAALQLVAWGEAPYGIVYATDALASPQVSVVWRIDDASHDPILYPAAPVAGARPQAGAYLDYLASPAAQEVFARYGFGVMQ